MKDKVKPIVQTVGGKYKLAPWIAEHIKRFEWSIYCEPFCRSAAVYIELINQDIPRLIASKGKTPRFVLNDIDSQIIELYQCCRDFPELLAYEVWATPYSREAYRTKYDFTPGNPLENCRQFLIKNRQNFFGNCITETWGIASGKNPKKKPQLFNKIPDRILQLSPYLGERFQDLKEGIELIPDSIAKKKAVSAFNAFLQEHEKANNSDCRVKYIKEHFPVSLNHILTELNKVYLENNDFQKTCEIWDGEETIYYFDPPYRFCEDYYKEVFSIEDHHRLAKLAHSLKGQILISYYPHPEITGLYSPSDWEYHEKTVIAHSGLNRPSRTELLLVRKNALQLKEDKKPIQLELF